MSAIAPTLPTPATPTAATQSIRLATTVTGGVSLAVWMGGVAREINLLSQASAWRKLGQSPAGHALSIETSVVLNLYLGLIDLLDVTVDTDVLSGTSAGGINAALLGYTRANALDLGNLRDLWLDLGAMLDLLRDPRDTDAPSLMYGDERMFAELNSNIPKLGGTGLPATVNGQAPRTTVLITTTLLNAETSAISDSYGTIVQDSDHRGLFTFDQDQLQTMHTSVNPEPLALAARSSASFPGAFEPSFLPFGTSTPETAKVPERPDMAKYSAITRSHWAADGGLIDNEPLDVMLERVFARRSSREVRRVLLFVVPSAESSPNILSATPGDDPAQPYGLLDSLRRDMEAMTNQSIASSLRTIHDHTVRSNARGGMRVELAALGIRLNAQRLMTGELLATYRSCSADVLAQKVVSAVLRTLTTWPAATASGTQATGTIPVTWQPALAPGGNAEQLCRDAIRKALTEESSPAAAAGAQRGESWWRGIRCMRPVRVQACHAAPGAAADPPPGAPSQATLGTSTLPADAAELASFGEAAFDDAHAAAVAIVRLGYRLARTADQRTQLSQLTIAINAPRSGGSSPHVRSYISGELSGGQLAKERKISSMSLSNALVELTRGYLGSTSVTAKAWVDLGTALVDRDSLTVLNGLLTAERDDTGAPPPPDGSVTARRQQAAAQLKVYLDYLKPDRSSAVDVALRLFDLASAQRAMLPANLTVDQPVEFIQVSADTRTLLDPNRRTAQDKLTGEQFHHFGAFYKRSWRANDWMWGRLDGGGWLVHLLLDPRRLKTITEQAGTSDVEPDSADIAARQPATAWLISKLAGLGVPELTDDATIPLGPAQAERGDGANGDSPPKTLTKKAVWKELSFLDDNNARMPVSVPLTSLWVAQALQTQIACEELPVVAKAACDTRDGQQPENQPNQIPTATAQWVTEFQRIRPADLSQQVAAQLTACPVPGETFSSDMGSPLMVRTAAKAAAATAAGIGSVKQLPSAVRPVVTSLRTVTLAGYRVTNAAGGKAPVMIWAGIIALVVGVALAIQQSTLLGVGGLIVAAIGVYLIVFGAWQTSRLALTAAISFTIVGLIASLALPVVRRGLFGTGSATDVGWVGKHVNHVISWLATSWWHPLVVVAVILLLPAAGILALNSFRKRTAHHSPKPTPKPATATAPLSNKPAPKATQETPETQKTPEAQK